MSRLTACGGRETEEESREKHEALRLYFCVKESKIKAKNGEIRREEQDRRNGQIPVKKTK